MGLMLGEEGLSRMRSWRCVPAFTMLAAFGTPATGVRGQVSSGPELLGTVYTSGGQALAGAEVVLDGGVTTRTDGNGNFRLNGLAIGPHVLTIGAPDYAARSFRFTVSWDSPGEIDLGAVMLEPARTQTAVLGSVTDSRSGDPIPAAVVTLDGTVSVATNLTGNFRIADVTPGRHLVQVKRIGFKRAVVNIDLPSDQAGVELEIRLDPVPVELPEIVVEGERTLYAYGRLRDFYERRRRGIGHFVTRWDIEKRQPHVVSDVLLGIPGLRIVPGALGRNTIELTDPSFSCRNPLVFLDGTLIGGANPDEFLNPQDVEGIEVYTRISEVPLQFSTSSGSVCGVIAVWTR